MNQKRIIAGAIDFFITAFIQTIMVFAFIILPIIKNRTREQKLDINEILIKMLMITFASVIYMIIRDNLGSKSIGKRIIGLNIVDNKTNTKASFVKRFSRNILWLLGPVEIIVLLITGSRIGDKITDTRVE